MTLHTLGLKPKYTGHITSSSEPSNIRIDDERRSVDAWLHSVSKGNVGDFELAFGRAIIEDLYRMMKQPHTADEERQIREMIAMMNRELSKARLKH
jgi:hypothetical protein